MADNFVNFIDMSYQNGQPWVILGAIGEGSDALDECDAGGEIVALSDDGRGWYSTDGGHLFSEVNAQTRQYRIPDRETKGALPDWAIAELVRMIEANKGRPPAMTG